jgi:4-hydroxy-tetrahydrodipicolinate synthase
MMAMPYYNKPSQQGLILHITQVSRAVGLPVVLYNIPGRSSVMLSVESTLRILETCPNVVAVKDATPGLDYALDLIRRAGERVTLLSGDDPVTLPMLSIGAKGVISVTSNLYPAGVRAMTDAGLGGDFAAARRLHERLLPIHRVLFSEPSPGPIKAALAQRGTLRDVLRSPMTSVTASCRAAIAKAMADYEAT